MLESNLYEVEGKYISIRQAAETYGISYSTLRGRIYRENLSLAEAIKKGKSQKKQITEGERFGHLICIKNPKASTKGGNARYVLECDCGNIVEVLGISLKSSKKTSCNLPDCNYSNRHHHKMSDKPEYNIWLGMIQRCTNPNNPSYPYYGGRGIKVCQSWLNSFSNFIKDVGERPSVKHSIDRINVEKDYDSSNVCWVLNEVQVRNKRKVNDLSKRITYLENLLRQHNINFD